MKAATIFFGSSGFIQIGYLPEMDDEGPVFHLRTVFVISGRWALLNAEETGYFFSFLRQQEECHDVDGGYIWAEDSPNEAFGFKFEKKGESRLVYIAYQKDDEQTITFPNVDIMRRILSYDKMINDFIFQKEVLGEEIKSDMIHIIDDLCTKCYESNNKTPLHLKEIGGMVLDAFTLELATNFFSFFSNVYYMKYSA